MSPVVFKMCSDGPRGSTNEQVREGLTGSSVTDWPFVEDFVVGEVPWLKT